MKYTQGFTLIELLIALSIGVIMVTMTTRISLSMYRSIRAHMHTIQQRTSLQAALDAIVKDLWLLNDSIVHKGDSCYQWQTHEHEITWSLKHGALKRTQRAYNHARMQRIKTHTATICTHINSLSITQHNTKIHIQLAADITGNHEILHACITPLQGLAL